MTLRPRSMVPGGLEPFMAGKTCPKCGRSAWGITWHAENRNLCNGPNYEEAHLHWTCPCGWGEVTKTKEDSR